MADDVVQRCTSCRQSPNFIHQGNCFDSNITCPCMYVSAHLQRAIALLAPPRRSRRPRPGLPRCKRRLRLEQSTWRGRHLMVPMELDLTLRPGGGGGLWTPSS